MNRRAVRKNHLQAAERFSSPSRVGAEARQERNGHPGLIVWLTGLSGAGKTTLATALEHHLFDRGCHTFLLDGDSLRKGLCGDLGFSEADRHENVRRVGEVAKLMVRAGLIVIVALISPFREDRDRVRAAMAPGEFIEVFVNAPLEICAQRDVKGLYARARNNEVRQFTGVSSPYEPPKQPELELRTDLASVQACLATLLETIGPALRSAARRLAA